MGVSSGRLHAAQAAWANSMIRQAFDSVSQAVSWYAIYAAHICVHNDNNASATHQVLKYAGVWFIVFEVSWRRRP